jgi:TRAP transporter 4TM/12TM fusion protein
MMGAGVFVMAELTGVPLVTILKYSILPAVLYFASIYAFVEVMAIKRNLTGWPESEIPKLKPVLARSWHLFIPLIVLSVLLVKGYTPFLASASCCVVVVIVSMIRKETRMGIAKILKALNDSTKNMLTISVIAACAAMIMGVITTTGLIAKVTSIVVMASHGSVLLALFLIAAISYVIGMGMPVVLSYILVATLGAPALAQLGVPILVAHLVIFWYSQDSTITPPVCMTAFVAAEIAKAKSYMRTGFITVKIAKGLYLIPLLFVYTPLVGGDLLSVLEVFIKALPMFFALAVAIEGFIFLPLRWWEIVAVSLGLILSIPALLTSGVLSFVYLLIGLSPCLIIGYRQRNVVFARRGNLEQHARQ